MTTPNDTNDLLLAIRHTQEGYFDGKNIRAAALGYADSKAFKAGFCDAIIWVNEVAETLKTKPPNA